MIAGHRILAVVPARSGSKGIPDKNMQKVAGVSLIGRVGRLFDDPALADIDCKLLSTDSRAYAEEGMRHGIACPFLRPAELARDESSALDVMQQVWPAAEGHFQCSFDVALILEPTCPLRQPDDVRRCLDRLLQSGADSVVTVSVVDTKFSPYKVLTLSERNELRFFMFEGMGITARQQVPKLYYRNGACYALTRRAIFEQSAILTNRTEAVVVDRPLVNIDEPLDLRFADWLARQGGS